MIGYPACDDKCFSKPALYIWKALLLLAAAYWCLIVSTVRALSSFHWSSWPRVVASCALMVVSVVGPGVMVHQNPHRRRGYQPMVTEDAGHVGA